MGFAHRLLFSALITASTASSALALPPVEAFGNLPEADQPRLSPDGQHLAMMQQVQGVPAVFIYQVNAPAGAKPAILKSDNWVVISFRWAKPDRLLLTLKMNVKAHRDDTLRTWVRYATVSADGNDLIMLMENQFTFGNNVRSPGPSDIDLDDPDNIFMPYAVGNFVYSFSPSVLRVDVRTGQSHKFEVFDGLTSDWTMDGHGNLATRTDTYRQQSTLYVRDGDGWKKSATFDFVDDTELPIYGLSEDGKAIMRMAKSAEGTNILMRRDLSTGAEEPLFSNPKYDVLPLTSPWTSRIVGATYADDVPHYRFFDSKREGLEQGVEAAFPNLLAHIASTDVAEDRLIVAVESPKHPPAYYYLDRTTHAATKIASSYPALAESDLGEMKPYYYKARDGLEIPAYITLPPGRDPKNLPAVVLPHGGPEERDFIDFFWVAQFLANRGYVVLQPNYRGSSGYGTKFLEAAFKQWGRGMQDDLTDGVKKMVADGIVDRKRICIVGESYGGYAALAGATFSPDIYACAVSFAGISDLELMLHKAVKDNGELSDRVVYLKSHIGDFREDSDLIHAASPVNFAANVKCPVLLMHEEDDTTVPIEQSEKMNDALAKAGKQVQFIRLKGDDHYFTYAETRIRMLTELEAFLKKNIGN